MRTRQDTQAQIAFQPPCGTAATTAYFERYERISELLDAHPEILAAVHESLEAPLSRMQKRGRRSRFTSEQVLRVVLVKAIENFSFREAVVRIDDSPRLRAFVRLHNDPMMTFSNLCMLANAVLPETWKKVNDMLARGAAQAGTITGEQLRMDTTATETNIHYPTDSHLLWDTYRTLTRLVHRVRAHVPALVSKRMHERAAKRLHTRISRASARKSDPGREAAKKQFSRLIPLVSGLLEWLPELCACVRKHAEQNASSIIEATALEGIVEQIEHFHALGLRVVDQASRRVLRGESVPNSEKIFSIFEPHTELLIRGKAGKAVEFGHMIAIQQVAGSFITDYGVFEKRPADSSLVDGALASHEALFGSRPETLAADKGFWESADKTGELRKSIACVSIPKKGSRTEKESAVEHTAAFRAGQRFRAGVEGSISFLKRMLGLARCMNKGFQHYVATVGVTILAHNLLVLARSG